MTASVLHHSLPTPLPLSRTLWPWLLRRVRRAFFMMVLLCLAIALFLTALDRGGFPGKLVYAYCIGFSCWICTDGLRLAWGAYAQRKRWQQGLPLAETGSFTSWRVLLPLFFLGNVMGVPLGISLGDFFWGGNSPSLLRWDATATRITLAISAVASLFAFFAMSTLERLASERIAAEQARAQASELELKLLQSQLEPHMLFNTLATLRVLIGLDPAQAQLMLDHLIAFLRATLNASRTPSHSLQTEFARVADYLALMSLRMGPRLSVELDLPAALQALPVPPLLLQPLVENSIRHGLEPQVRAGRLRVAARRDGQQLLLTVRDTGVGLQAAAPTGGTNFGLEQIRARLRSLHGDKASLSLAAATDAEGGTLATITLPWPGDAAATSANAAAGSAAGSAVQPAGTITSTMPAPAAQPDDRHA